MVHRLVVLFTDREYPARLHDKDSFVLRIRQARNQVQDSTNQLMEWLFVAVLRFGKGGGVGQGWARFRLQQSAWHGYSSGLLVEATPQCDNVLISDFIKPLLEDRTMS